MTNSEIHQSILNNLFQALEKQSEAYLTLMSNQEYTHEQRKDFETEISQINKVLQEINSSSVNYTVTELEALKDTFNDKLIQLSQVVTDLEINTLKIEFDSLTPQQKEFLKGAKGDKGDKGENGLNGTFESLTLEQKSSLKGEKGEKGDKGENGTNGINGTNGVNGIDGLSVYQIALNNGFVGTELQFLESLKGQDGLNGTNGVNGIDGLSAYQIALNNGFVGTELQFLESLKGQNGLDGVMSFKSLTLEQKATLKGEKGDKGDKGENGLNGLNGENGLSAYQIALNNGFVGTELQFLDSLKGEKGQKGDNGQDGIDGTNGTFETLTQEQKQEIANLITVTSSGSAVAPLSASVPLIQVGGTYGSVLNVKTNIKATDTFLGSFRGFYFKQGVIAPTIIERSLNFYQLRNLEFNTLETSFSANYSFFDVYTSNDGYLCLAVKNAMVSTALYFDVKVFSDYDFQILDKIVNPSSTYYQQNN